MSRIGPSRRSDGGRLQTGASVYSPPEASLELLPFVLSRSACDYRPSGPPDLEPQKEFVLVGVGHMVGEDGLIEQLKRRGYDVKQLNSATLH